jgi:hypothetical protein
LKCTPDAAISLQSNAHDAEGKNDAAASRGSSVVCDLEGAMAVNVIRGEGLCGSNVRVERDGCGGFDSRTQVQREMWQLFKACNMATDLLTG